MTPTHIVRLSAILALAGMTLQPGFGQGRGQTGTGTPGAGTSTGAGSGAGSIPGTGTGSTTRPTVPPPGTQQPSQNTQQQMPQQPIFVSGRVLMEDGTPAVNVVIERVCSGSPRSEGYTDTKGYFSVQLGARNGAMLHDASEDMGGGFGAGAGGFGGGMGGAGSSMGSNRGSFGGMDTRLIDCELRARMPGYRSQSVSLANRRPMDPPDVGVILVHRLGETEGSTVSAISLNAPKDARKAYEKGMEALKKKKADDALKNFEKAVEVYPKYAIAWQELGRLQAAKGDSEAARKSFESAVAADSKFVPPYLEMAMIEWKAEKWDQVADLTGKVVKLDPFDYPVAHFLNSLANFQLKNIDAAEKSAREALRLDTRRQYLTSMRLLGAILATKQDYSGAAEQFKAYLAAAPQAQDAATVRGQLSQVEKLLAEGKQ